MSKKKINKEQLDALFDFMRRKRVHYYDLQVEWVDFSFLFYILFYQLPQQAVADLQRHFPKYIA